MKRRKIALFMAALMVLFLAGSRGRADLDIYHVGNDPVTGLGYAVPGRGSYALENATYCFITSMGACEETDLVLPTEIEGKSVAGLLNFWGGEQLTSITFPRGVSCGGYYSFTGMSNLKAIYVNEDHEYNSSLDGVLFNKEQTRLVRYPNAKEKEAYSAPSTVIGMEYKAFAGCTELQTLNLPTTAIQAPMSYWDEEGEHSINRIYINTSVQDIFFLTEAEDVVEITSITGDGWAETDENDFRIHYGFGLSRQPESMEVQEGDTAVFEAEAVGQNLTFLWEYKGESGEWQACSSTLQGYNTTRLQVPAESGNNGKQFRLKTVRGGEINYSSKVTLTVKERGTWRQNAKGWWYQRTDGTYPVNQWEKIGGKWYHFDAKGYMQTGWLELNGKYYYLKESGAMATGWAQVNGKYYFMNSSGVMQTGWLKDGSKWYYLAASGAMQTGWKTINGVYYFFKSSGAMASNEWWDGYWLNANGSWTYKYKATWHQNAKGWWFGDTSGWYAKNCTITIDGKSYTFDAKGYLK